MRQVKLLDVYDLRDELVQAFDRLLAEECAERGIYGSGVKDVDVVYFLGETDLVYHVAIAVKFDDLATSNPTLYTWEDGSWWIVDDELEEDDWGRRCG